MSNPILYTLIVGLIIIPLLILYQNRKVKSNKFKKKVFTQHEVASLNRLLPIITGYKWSVLIRDSNEIKLDFDDDDLGAIGYHIYNTYKTQLTQNQVSVYIKNNVNNNYLKIVTDEDSESMISVDHPIQGHLGYLSYIEVDKI